MALLLFANRAETTLAGPISAGSTTANLAAGTGALFPSPATGQQFVLTFTDAAQTGVNEIVYVTARSTDTITIVRGREGTAAAAWAANDRVDNYWTAGSAAVMVQEAELQLQPGNYATASGTNSYTIALTPSVASLALLTGAPIRFQPTNANTSSVSLTITGAGTASVVNPDGTNLGAGQIIGGIPVEVIYNGSRFVLIGNPYALLSRTSTWVAAQTYTQTITAVSINSSGNVAVTGAITGGSGTIGGVGFSGGTITSSNISSTAGTIGAIVMSGGNLNTAGTLTAAAATVTFGTIGGVTLSSNNLVAPGQVSAATLASSSGNITSAARLRAVTPATGTGDPNCATLLADFVTTVTGINQFTATRPDQLELQVVAGNAGAGGGLVSSIFGLPRTFSGGIISAIGSLNGNSPPSIAGTVAVQPGPGNNQVTVTTNFPGAVSGGLLGVTVYAYGAGPLT